MLISLLLSFEDSKTESEIVEFKLSNQVFVQGSTLPRTTNLTLFQDQRVFDFRFKEASEDVVEMAIFDAQDRSFVLLDVQRKLRLKIDNLQLLRILEGMREELKDSPKVSHLLFEDAKETYDPEKNSIRVANSRIQYDVTGKRPQSDQILIRYLRFLENYTMLSITDPKRMPPFARIKVNRAIKKFGILPSSVSLKIRNTDESQLEIAARSRHEFQSALSERDRNLIDSARKYWMEFREVGLAEYRGIRVADLPDGSTEKTKQP